MNDNVLEIKNLLKDFPGVRAVNDVSFDIKRNTIHCLVGENGAGKSTLIKILTGAFTRTSGKIFLNGEEYSAHNPKHAGEQGISTLFQELNVVDQLTVEENLTLGIEDTKFGFLRKTNKIKKIIEVLKDIEPSIDPKERVSRLSVAKKQIIEIAKAVASDADVIIMDEPTAALSEGEIERLFKIIKKLREQNVTVIYISHRLDEIFELGDYVTVMRDGMHIGTKPLTEVKDRMDLIKMMIGKTVIECYEPRDDMSGEVVLKAKNITNHKLKDISFDVKKGEIVGFYGLVGAGKTELARAIYGADKYSGNIMFNGKKLGHNPGKTIDAGIALVPEERRTQGLFTLLTIKRNIPVMNMKKISRAGLINAASEKNVSKEYIETLSIKTDSMEKETAKLSGGNQQKVVFSKCLFADADLLILDEPTRGIDVGAKAEIYHIIRELAKEGKSIIFFSSELPEILNSCDRIFLLFEGEMRSELQNGDDIDNQSIIHICTGGN
ncbi:MAG: sugar ABC transporter ATP-binding protein [Clostridia bacterium]|jgi:ribose transport system ATP-binding protein|nr:sugar ABC transporter ATP-binding protein [Clostridia bacterium]MBT7123065.1 sugar ABC transporter ATP-binding protein [Clostridia bacterium]